MRTVSDIFFQCLFSPGVIVTEVHKRGGMTEENYAKVSRFAHLAILIGLLRCSKVCNYEEHTQSQSQIKVSKQIRAYQPAFLPLYCRKSLSGTSTIKEEVFCHIEVCHICLEIEMQLVLMLSS